MKLRYAILQYIWPLSEFVPHMCEIYGQLAIRKYTGFRYVYYDLVAPPKYVYWWSKECNFFRDCLTTDKSICSNALDSLLNNKEEK